MGLWIHLGMTLPKEEGQFLARSGRKGPLGMGHAVKPKCVTQVTQLTHISGRWRSREVTIIKWAWHRKHVAKTCLRIQTAEIMLVCIPNQSDGIELEAQRYLLAARTQTRGSRIGMVRGL